MASPTPNPIEPPRLDAEMSLQELTGLLIRHFGFHEGLYEFSAVMTVTIGTFAMQVDHPLPGTLSVLSGVGLRKTEKTTPLSVDAAKVNPASMSSKVRRGPTRKKT